MTNFEMKCDIRTDPDPHASKNLDTSIVSVLSGLEETIDDFATIPERAMSAREVSPQLTSDSDGLFSIDTEGRASLAQSINSTSSNTLGVAAETMIEDRGCVECPLRDQCLGFIALDSLLTSSKNKAQTAGAAHSLQQAPVWLREVLINMNTEAISSTEIDSIKQGNLPASLSPRQAASLMNGIEIEVGKPQLAEEIVELDPVQGIREGQKLPVTIIRADEHQFTIIDARAAITHAGKYSFEESDQIEHLTKMVSLMLQRDENNQPLLSSPNMYSYKIIPGTYKGAGQVVEFKQRDKKVRTYGILSDTAKGQTQFIILGTQCGNDKTQSRYLQTTGIGK